MDNSSDKFFYVVDIAQDRPISRSNSRDYAIVSAKDHSENKRVAVVAPDGREVIRFYRGKQIT